MLGDVGKAEKRSWDRFIEAFKELAAAQDAVVAASSVGDSTKGVLAAAAETELRSAMDAFTASLATSLPVRAAINASRAEQMAGETLAHFPDLKLHGSNSLTYDTLKVELKEVCDATHLLLRQAEQLGPAAPWYRRAMPEPASRSSLSASRLAIDLKHVSSSTPARRFSTSELDPCRRRCELVLELHVPGDDLPLAFRDPRIESGASSRSPLPQAPP
jgi:hypothetical protein